MTQIYLDHAATTPIHPKVIEAMAQSMERDFANPSSNHAFGKAAHQTMDQARQVLAESIGAQASEIVLTSSGTESDNMAILGTARSRSNLGRHIISTQVEHPGVMEALKLLEGQGFEVTYLPVSLGCRISIEDFKEALRPDTILVTIMTANNEMGTLQPLKEIGDHLKAVQSQAYFHTDAVQAYNLYPLNVDDLNLDMLSVSGHKLNGPKGIGFLYVRQGIELPAMLVGGGQEAGRRSSTENIPGLVGLAQAVEIAQTDQAGRRQTVLDFGDQLLAGLDRISLDYSINGDRSQTVGHVLNLHLHGLASQDVISHLNKHGIAVSAGSACDAGCLKPSPVLLAMYGPDHPALAESIRFSFGWGTSSDHIETTVQALSELKEEMKD